MTPGTVFEHRHWLDVKNMPLLCRVTAVRHGLIYWAIWGPERPGKAKYTFRLGEAGRHVGQIISAPQGQEVECEQK